MHNQITFCELRRKKVINVVDGRNLGCVIDLVMEDCSGIILGFLVPNLNSLGLFSFFRSQQTFIPWQNICKIGEDAILVEMFDSYNCIDTCSVQNLDATKKDKDPKDYFSDYSRQSKKQNNPKNIYQSAEQFKVYDNPQKY